MKIIKWLLSAIFALAISLNLISIFDGKWVVNGILFAVATALVLPPLDPTFAKKLSALKSHSLRIFLAVVLALAGLIIGVQPALTFDSISICPTILPTTKPTTNLENCSADLVLFSEGMQSITIRATLDDDSLKLVDAIALDITALDNPDNSALLNQLIDIDSSNLDVVIELEDLDLEVGTYEVEIIPESEEERTRLSKRQKFVVLPSAEDVAKRTNSAEGVNRFKATIDELIVCADPGGDNHCAEPKGMLDTTEVVLADVIIADPEADYTWLGNGPELTFVWRVYAEDTNEPEIFLRETVEIEENTSLYGFPLGLDGSGLPPGSYDVIALLETADSRPVRVPFSVTE